MDVELGDKVLDVATASGTLALALADKVGPKGTVVGIDLAKGMLDYAERKARARKSKNIEFREMNAQQLEFDDNIFDVVGSAWRSSTSLIYRMPCRACYACRNRVEQSAFQRRTRITRSCLWG